MEAQQVAAAAAGQKSVRLSHARTGCHGEHDVLVVVGHAGRKTTSQV